MYVFYHISIPVDFVKVVPIFPYDPFLGKQYNFLEKKSYNLPYYIDQSCIVFRFNSTRIAILSVIKSKELPSTVLHQEIEISCTRMVRHAYWRIGLF